MYKNTYLVRNLIKWGENDYDIIECSTWNDAMKYCQECGMTIAESKEKIMCLTNISYPEVRALRKVVTETLLAEGNNTTHREKTLTKRARNKPCSRS